MPATRQRENGERQQGESRKARIAEQVILALGKPGDLLTVQVRHLWQTCYRVNVFVGPNVISGRVSNSYFLKADEDGVIIASTPTVTKQYGLVDSPHPPAADAPEECRTNRPRGTPDTTSGLDRWQDDGGQR